MRNTGYKIFNIKRVWLSFFFVLASAWSHMVCAQTVHINIGQTQTSTPFRTSNFILGGNYLLIAPKCGLAGEIGMEYAIKTKSSFYSSFSLYQSGAKLEEVNVPGENPFLLFDLDDNKYTYNSWSLNTNYNMEVWRAGKVKLLAVTGLHLDYILYESDAEEDFRHFKPSEDPLEILVRFGALRKLNIGCNMGGRLVYTANQWSYSLNYTYAPRLLKMGKFEKEIDVGNLGVMNGISVKEKVSFITLGVGYNLKGTK